jgi:hypothetical protein
MDPALFTSAVEGIIVEHDDAILLGDEERKKSLAVTLYSKLSEDNTAYAKFYQDLTFDTAVAASQYRILQGHLLRDSCPLDNGRHEKVNRTGLFRRRKTKIGSSGFLDSLPLHIFQELLEGYVDIETLTTLRRVNRSIRAAVDSTPTYVKIVQQTPQILRAALSMHAAFAFTCSDLWAAFVAKECTRCRKFGAFLYLPTCSRVCFSCGMDAPACRPLTLDAVKRYYSITEYELRKHGVAVLHPLPGRYHNSRPDKVKPTGLVDMAAAARVAGQLYGVSGDAFA